MATSIEITSDLRVQLEEVLNGVAHLDTPDLEKFLADVAQLLVQRKVKTIPKREAELLFKINQRHLTSEEQESYEVLYGKLQQEAIADDEHQKLLELIQIKEEKGVERMSCLVELAQLRKVKLQKLMKELGIHSLADAA